MVPNFGSGESESGEGRNENVGVNKDDTSQFSWPCLHVSGHYSKQMNFPFCLSDV